MLLKRHRGRIAANLPRQLPHVGDGTPSNAFQPDQAVEVDVLATDQRRALHLGQHAQLSRVPDRKPHADMVGRLADLAAKLPLQLPHPHALAASAIDSIFLNPGSARRGSAAGSRADCSTVGNAA
jgi:hypothetical protein